MKKQLFTALILLFAGSLPLMAQHSYVTRLYDPGSEMRDHNLNFIHMRLSVEFEPKKGHVIGDITHYFKPIRDRVDSFFLDGPGIHVHSATLNGKAVTYKTTADGIYFYPETPLYRDEDDILNIKYDAYPRKGIYFIGWNDPNNLSRKQIWTQGEGIDNRNWFPCYDSPNDKLTTEVIVKFDKDYEVLSNGVKVEEKKLNDGTRLWHYKMSHPHSTYLVMLGIGKYDIKETHAASGVPLRQWYYPEWKDRYKYTYKDNEKVFNFMENEIGVPYAWESYSQIPVQDFMYGAMENTTATLFGDFFEVDARSYNDRNYVEVNAHELAHQWFGDLVSAATTNNQWLQESFATHYSLLADRVCFGQDYFHWALRQNALAALRTTDKKPIANSQAPSSVIYQKGSVVLEMLKYVTGREGFNRSIKRYLLAHKYQNVNSNNLLDAFQDETGMPLRWFWDEWIYRGGEPDYKVSYEDITAGGNRCTQFVVSQVQPVNEVMGLFRMPIVFEVHYTDGTTDKKKEWIEKETQVVQVPNRQDKEISFVLFDPNSQVLKTVSFNKPFGMLKAQALHAPDMLDRYDAVYAMRDIAPDKKRELLKQVFEASAFHAIKTEIVIQLLGDEESEDIIRMALHDKDVQVRKGVIVNTKTIPAALEADYEPLLVDSSYTTIETALEKLCADFPANTDKYLAMTKGIDGTHGRDVLIKWLEISIAEKQDNDQINQLTAFTSESYEFMTRCNAMTALQHLNYFDNNVLANCINASLSYNGRLAGPAAQTLKYFYAQDKYKQQVAAGIAASEVSGKDKERLEKLVE